MSLVMENDGEMSSTDDHERAPELVEDAIDWLVLLQSGQATEGDRAAFMRWRRRSDGHEAAAREAETLWDEIGQTATARMFVPDVVPITRRFGGLSRRALLAGAVTASVGGLTLASGVAGPMAGIFADYRTSRGERRRELLPDGSAVWLNTQTALSARYTNGARRLTLHTGEALFEVRRDAARPFIVEAAGGHAQALGTVYAVRHIGRDVEVDVVEGMVQVRPGVGMADRRLTADRRTRYADGHFLTAVEPVNASAVTAWQRGKLIFNRQPLGQVVAELQRQRYGRILIADDALEAMPVTGVFDLDDDEATLAMLRETLPLEITQLPMLTVLRRNPST